MASDPRKKGKPMKCCLQLLLNFWNPAKKWDMTILYEVCILARSIKWMRFGMTAQKEQWVKQRTTPLGCLKLVVVMFKSLQEHYQT